ncbi:pyridoxal phosphate-dependent aminotransferase [Salarchaeum sp. JOR-1]|uniref:pyridoxal phosphate-dependent aminotransferase n=1 Tax=Salarchaeum sp. JOR-1 TaxID=2599399 RepID=UPI00119878CC|nr:pyridoxal phosphate-dependent aminotransferase [Salarchaeum sp. JOR-1]QDX40996.1 pyridoxal phosphate-dependent aminotransferase [Salarchaeum sp. JOR-1]
MFPDIDYLTWKTGRPEVAMYDLGTSDLRGDRDRGGEVVPAPLEGLDDPPTGASLEMQIAGEYGVEPEQVLVTGGATQANFLAAAAALDASDADGPRALVEKPGYEPLVASPRALGAHVDRFRRDEDDALSPSRVRKALTPDTALVTVTNRHNPSGRLAARETLAETATVARDGGARLLVDEVYAPYLPEAEDGPFGGPSAVEFENAAVTGSLTKFFGLGDLRIGWLVADEAFVERARAVSHHVRAVAGPSRTLAMRALHNRDPLAERSRTLLAENAELLSSFVAERDDLAGSVAPGSTFAFLDPANADGNAVAERAWENGLLVVPGRFFGDSERVRVSLGLAPNEMAAALDTFGDVLDRFR